MDEILYSLRPCFEKNRTKTGRYIQHMTDRKQVRAALMVLLQEEVDCLRSVLSEYGEHDKSEYTQWVRANILRDAIETMDHKL